jgi:lysozyme
MRRRGILTFCLLLAAEMALAQDGRFEEAVTLIKRYEGMHDERHYPYVGYGHKLLQNEHYPVMTEERADSLLRADLRQKCRVFRRFGRDSLLLGVLAYNVGEYRLLGYGERPKSRLVRKLEAGERDIRAEYVSFCRYRGKAVASLRQRREDEYELLYNE